MVGFLPEPSNRWARKPEKRVWIRPTAKAADIDPSVAATQVVRIGLEPIQYVLKSAFRARLATVNHEAIEKDLNHAMQTLEQTTEATQQENNQR